MREIPEHVSVALRACNDFAHGNGRLSWPAWMCLDIHMVLQCSDFVIQSQRLRFLLPICGQSLSAIPCEHRLRMFIVGLLLELHHSRLLF